MRPKTGIIVNVLDFSALEEKILQEGTEAIKKKLSIESEVSSVRNFCVWGMVDTEEGTYILNCLGQGPITPLTRQQTTDFVFEFHAVFGENCEFVLLETPFFVIPVTRDVCMELGISHTMPLEDFVVRHIPKTEENFQWWMGKLSSIVAKGEEEEEEVENKQKEDLSKYGPFLVSDKCDCVSNKAPLVKVEGNCCPCGKFGKHTHCRKCGKVM